MKMTALARLTLDPDPAPHQLHQLRGDRQAKARAAEPARCRRIGLHEGAEDLPLLLGLDADPRIRDGEPQDRRLDAEALEGDLDDHFSTFGELDRVSHEVHDDLAQASGVPDERIGYLRQDPARELQ